MRNLIAGTVAALGTAALATAVLAATASAAGAHSVPACGNNSLAVTHTASQGAVGHSNMIIKFRNVGYSPCSLYGYPGFDALGSYGAVMKHAKRTVHGFTGGAGALNTVVLAPGKYASADVEWMNFNPVTSGACDYSSSIAITPANTSDTHNFPVSVSVCELQIHPTVAGKSGNG